MNQFNRRYFRKILTKYRLGNATDEEVKFLEAYYNLFDLNEDLIGADNEKDFQSLKKSIKKNIDQQIHDYSGQTSSSKIKVLWIRYTAAAVILALITVAILFNNKPHITTKQAAIQSYKGVAPGGNKAVLTLSDGTQIPLDDASKGNIATQAGVVISKQADGMLVYEVNTTQNSGQNQSLQNSISTPKGGQYKVILPDGTGVWLNAASSITYPTAFTGDERLVTVTGEAYFEVAKNKEKPFRVKSAGQIVEVLGTHFNINAYADEAGVKTTLLEGSVKVSTPGRSATITPGEQAIVDRNHVGVITRKEVDTDEEVAWKNGVFSFKGEDIRSIMRQIARWYNIDVAYEDNISDERYFGEISRNSSLNDVFKILELNNVKFTVEGKTVTVSDKNKPQ